MEVSQSSSDHAARQVSSVKCQCSAFKCTGVSLQPPSSICRTRRTSGCLLEGGGRRKGADAALGSRRRGQWQTWTWNVQVESMFRIAASTSRLSRSTGPESGGRRHRARGSNALLWPAGGQRCRVPSASVRGMGVVLAEALRLSRARKCSLMWPVWPGRVSGPDDASTVGLCSKGQQQTGLVAAAAACRCRGRWGPGAQLTDMCHFAVASTVSGTERGASCKTQNAQVQIYAIPSWHVE